ncbi:hypothetical protein PUN28_007736 [Cardiocondyla obscurior]|uniref:Uncharacterized protein n=1 Tax=Cardiocondyla obscurior TaxID=286306 RepID=A0AAW2FVI3_9HYME
MHFERTSNVNHITVLELNGLLSSWRATTVSEYYFFEPSDMFRSSKRSKNHANSRVSRQKKVALLLSPFTCLHVKARRLSLSAASPPSS